jgi:type III secretion protein N (ATPase)
MTVQERTATAADTLTERLKADLRKARPLQQKGRVIQAFGTTVRVTGIHARIGQQCLISDRAGNHGVLADVVGLAEHQAILLPLGNLQGIAVDSEVEVLEDSSTVAGGEALLGRVVDCLGKPLDHSGLPADTRQQPLYVDAPDPLSRQPITEQFSTGVRAIDSLLTMGVGQRAGIFAMAGGGKSTLLSMLAKQSQSDVIVIALIGERGREVREFIEHQLGEEGMRRAVVVVSTSDRPAMERVRAAYAATAIAEGFRDQGKRVLFLMDSVTRFARALREIGLAVGEPAVRRGYPPSVFAELPKLFERTGNNAVGSITAFYTVLTEDDDGNDPIAEEVRSILDGHIILTRKLGQAGHYPAIDVLESTSRIANQITTAEQQHAARHIRALLAKHAEIEFLIQVGEYQTGSDTLADEAINKLESIRQLLRQHPEEASALTDAMQQMETIANAQ